MELCNYLRMPDDYMSILNVNFLFRQQCALEFIMLLFTWVELVHVCPHCLAGNCKRFSLVLFFTPLEKKIIPAPFQNIINSLFQKKKKHFRYSYITAETKCSNNISFTGKVCIQVYIISIQHASTNFQILQQVVISTPYVSLVFQVLWLPRNQLMCWINRYSFI